MDYEPINLIDKFSQFTEHWSPKIIAKMNNYHFKIVKFQGEFVWHNHSDTDEVFIIIDGEMIVHFKDRDVRVKSGEIFVVPKGLEHKTSAQDECKAMLVEIEGTVNTGNTASDRIPTDGTWI